MNKQKKQALVILLAMLVLLSGCQKQNIDRTAFNGEIVVALNSDTGTLDPAGMIALTYLSYQPVALDGLLTFDQSGAIEYRGAVSYEVNEAMTVWTFHLRKEALWSDGTKVTAQDYIHTIKRALKPASGSGYANYLFPIKNAEAIYQGTAAEAQLGVTAKDEYTLVFTLAEPCVYFLDLLSLPVYMPSCAAYADSTDSGWDKDPESSLSNGPFSLCQYQPEEYFTVEKNEHYWNAEAVKLERITYRFFDNQQAMLSAYQSGAVDLVMNLPAAAMELYQDTEGFALSEMVATRYLYPNLAVAPLDDIRVRKALSLSINRQELCTLLGGGTEPTYNLVAKYLKNRTTGAYFTDEEELPFQENLKQARELLAAAGYPDGEGFPVLTYKYPSLEMDADTAQVLQEQWKKNLNIEVELVAQELQMNYSDRRAGRYDLCRMNWTADFADPYTYLSMLLSNSTYNSSGISDQRYDQLISASNKELDATKRTALLHEAERLAVGEECYVIPLFGMKSGNLIRPGITGVRQIPASGALELRYVAIKE